MRLCRYTDSVNPPRLGLLRDEALYDLTAVDAGTFGSMAAWLRHPKPVEALRTALGRLREPVAIGLEPEDGFGFPVAESAASSGLGTGSLALPSLGPGTPKLELFFDMEPSSASALPFPVSLLAPLDAQEVWAAGVTYLRSKEARMEESRGASSFYDRVYEAERPELFLKATPSRVVGPEEAIRIRRDAEWSVPEPEVALVISAGLEIVGYTVGNDVSSRDIEGANPLYLPQAKVYRQCCALGPTILVEEEGAGHRELAVRLTIERDGKAVFAGETSTGRMKRRFEELVEYLGRDNLFPDGVFLLTGTGIVPPDDFTLQPGDVVSIGVPGIGMLRNPVTRDA